MYYTIAFLVAFILSAAYKLGDIPLWLAISLGVVFAIVLGIYRAIEELE